MAAPENSGNYSKWRLFFPHGIDMKTSIRCMYRVLSSMPDGRVRNIDVIIISTNNLF